MASLSEFVYWRGFGYVKLTDLSGPYAFDGISTFTLIGSGGGGVTWDAGVTWDGGTFWV